MGGQRGGGKGGGRGGGRGGGKGKGGKGPGFTQVIPKFLQQYRHIIEGEKRPDAVGYEALGDSAVDGCVRAPPPLVRTSGFPLLPSRARSFLLIVAGLGPPRVVRTHTQTPPRTQHHSSSRDAPDYSPRRCVPSGRRRRAPKRGSICALLLFVVCVRSRRRAREQPSAAVRLAFA